jgi:predicted esterase
MLLLALLLAELQPAAARPSWTGFYQATPQQIAAPPGTLLKFEVMRTPGFFRGKAWRILYATRDYLGRPIASSGIVVLSGYAAANPAERSIVAWAHPTTGIARHCAPTLAKSPLGTINGLNELIPAGHIIAATDYPGLGTPGPIGYLVGRGQAFAVIDSVRAARQIPGVGGGSRYALWGYSQGGQAALFADRLAGAYAPELKLVGTAAVAPPTNLAQLFRNDMSTVAGRVLASFALGSWAVKYRVPLVSAATGDALADIARVNSNCVTDLAGLLDINRAQKPLSDRFLSIDPTVSPPWSGFMAGNSIAMLPRGSNAIILQGTSDAIVSPRVTRTFVQNSCRNGARVFFVELQSKGHGSSAKAAVPKAISWINSRFAGRATPITCR